LSTAKRWRAGFSISASTFSTMPKSKHKGHPAFAGCPSQASGSRLGRFPELNCDFLRIRDFDHVGAVAGIRLTHLICERSGVGC
jgi:hypothetical protein